MSAIRRTRTTVQRAADRRKAARTQGAAAKPSAKALTAAPQQVLYRFCKPGWAVIVEKTPSATGTRFVCPFCTISHRVPGPVRGFRQTRRARWIKLRRSEE